ncbi:MAG: thiamine pyrophosphate-binding protein [Cephaloticoccus sp.]|nr:thiamine pyrophosphate-binding protein [Cephaloticoccus sp.]MCF7759713.1 thiamine pyrophosphate-binding protein [Cephaloticoccus sp.]
MSEIKVSDYLAKYLVQLGVKHVFVVSGGGNLNLLDSIAHNPALTYVCNHHEQAAAMAAEAYSRVSDNIGVCLVTFGPAATNTLTGVAGAWLDSIPVLYMSGQVKRDNLMTGTKLRQLGVQEINITEIVTPMTKYAALVSDPADIRFHLEKAVHAATSGRPGPVFLDIPADVQASLVDETTLRSFQPDETGTSSALAENLSAQVTEVLRMLQVARRPLIFAGHGITLAKARNDFQVLADRLQIPVVTSMSSHDLIPTDHPLVTGRPGVFGDRAGNFAVQNADVILSIGVRHHLWNIGYNYEAFAPTARKIVVDIDPAELTKKTVIPELAIEADAKMFLQELARQAGKYSGAHLQDWQQQCQTWKQAYPVVLPEHEREESFVNSYYFTGVLAQLMEEGEIIVTGVGTSFTGTRQCINLKKGQRLHSNIGCASMGYDLPAAIGAAFASDRRRIVLLTGEGSLMMNLQELQTIRHYRLPIKIFLFNNDGYLAIKNSQGAFFDRRFAAVDANSGVSFPDFRKLADAFGLDYVHIEHHCDNLEQKILGVLDSAGPVLCDLHMSPTQTLWPKVYSEKLADGSMHSRPIEDMFPFLDREEFNRNMLNQKSVTPSA